MAARDDSILHSLLALENPVTESLPLKSLRKLGFVSAFISDIS